MAIEKLTVLTGAAGAARLVVRLEADEIDPPLAVSRFLAADGWQVDALFEAPFDRARLGALLDGVALAVPAEIAAVAETNWVAHVEATLKPIAAGPFLVHGPHDRAAAQSHPLAIEIEAGGAFGTAHHATTQGCLAALETVIGAVKPARLLDLGTGSGILAIAAAKLMPSLKIIATDIDPEAVSIAAENAAINGVAERIRAIAADGLEHPELNAARFDVILANILAEPLIALAPGLGRALAPGGAIVLSGLLAEQQAAVLAAYERQGHALRQSWPVDGWVTMWVG